MIYLAAAGCCIALAFAARTPTVIALPAALVTVWLAKRWRGLLHAALLVTTFVLTYQAFLFVLRVGYGFVYLSQSVGWSLVVGTNYNYGGVWIQNDDMKQFNEQIRLTNCDAANQWALNRGLHRIVDEPIQFAALNITKIFNQWSDDTYTTKFLSPITSWIGLNILQQEYYVGLLALLVLSLFRLVGRFDNTALMPMMFLAGLALLHVFLEVMPRYYFIAIPMMMWVILIVHMRQPRVEDAPGQPQPQTSTNLTSERVL